MECDFQPSAKRLAGCFLTLCCLILPLLTGCSGTSTVNVRGKVTFQGKPLESGVICFISADGKGDTKAADIKDGQYAIQLLQGPKIVEISSLKVVGQNQGMVGGQLRAVDVKKEAIPSQYNKQSTLRADIAAGNEELDFNL